MCGGAAGVPGRAAVPVGRNFRGRKGVYVVRFPGFDADLPRRQVGCAGGSESRMPRLTKQSYGTSAGAAQRRRAVRTLIVSVALVAAVAGGAALAYSRDDSAAERTAEFRPPTAAAKNQLPDTSVPDWGRPYRDADAAKPRYAQTISGIRLVPPRGDESVAACKPGEAKYASQESGDASSLAVRSPYLAASAQLDPAFTEQIECAGRIVVLERFYVVQHEPAAPERITSGEVSWFDVEHGGYLWVTRMILTGPAWGGADVPSDQWSEATVAGLPAAVGTTAMQGFGHSSVVVWDASTGILTAIKALDRPIEEVLKVAEEVIRQSS